MGEDGRILEILRLVRGMMNSSLAEFNSGQQPCGFAIFDALLYIAEYIEDELGIRLGEGEEAMSG